MEDSLREKWTFWFVLALQTLPIWLFQYFPSQDGPIHLYNCTILKVIFTSQPSFAQSYYTLNPYFPVNVLGHWLLTGLLFVASPLIAEKLLITVYVVTLGLSVRFAFRSIRPESLFLSFLILPMAFNYTVTMGFYNFILAVPLFFWTYGYWRRHADNLTWRSTTILAAALLVMYLAHLFVVVLAMLIFGILVFAALLQAGHLRFWQVPQFRTTYAVLPALAASVLFVLQHRSDTKYENPFHGWRELPADLFHDNFVVSYYKEEGVIALALMAFLLGITAWKAKGRWKLNGPALVLGITFVLYLIVPDGMIGGSYTRTRFLLFVAFCDLLWLAQFSYSRRFVQLTATASIVMALALAGFHTAAFRKLNPMLREFVAAGSVMENDKSMLLLNYSVLGRTATGERIARRSGAFRHPDGYIGMDRRLGLVDNYEAKMKYFPIAYVEGQNPFPMIVDLYDEPPCADLDAYVAARHRPMDYILIWYPEAQDAANVCVQKVMNHVNTHYKRVYTSPNNLAHVYRLN